MKIRFILSYIAIIITVSSVNAQTSLNLTRLNQAGTNQWDRKVFSNRTDYAIVTYKDRFSLNAKSTGSASGLVLEKRIDLLKTPILNWSWLIKNRLPKLNERTKAGDDYAARVYVVIDGGFLPWTTQSLSYVWSSSQDKNIVWDNAYAGTNVKMLSVRGEQDEINKWYEEKRNVYQDLIQYFGDKGSVEANQDSYRYIDAVAIMTDTDDSNSLANSYYGDIIFTEE